MLYFSLICDCCHLAKHYACVIKYWPSIEYALNRGHYCFSIPRHSPFAFVCARTKDIRLLGTQNIPVEDTHKPAITNGYHIDLPSKWVWGNGIHRDKLYFVVKLVVDVAVSPRIAFKLNAHWCYICVFFLCRCSWVKWMIEHMYTKLMQTHTHTHKWLRHSGRLRANQVAPSACHRSAHCFGPLISKCRNRTSSDLQHMHVRALLSYAASRTSAQALHM